MRRILFAVAAERGEVMMVVVTVAGSQVEQDVDPPSVVRERLEEFALEVLAEAMNRPVQVRNGGLYLRGLIEDGARKSLEPLVARVGEEADYQSMQQFLADSPWDPALVVKAVAERVAPVIGVEAWVLDDTGFPKDGKDSPGVKRQYSGTLGKTGNCQIGVSVHAVGVRGTVPLGWALYLPEDWCEDDDRRRKAKIPDEVTFKTKPELGVELVEPSRGTPGPNAYELQAPRQVDTRVTAPAELATGSDQEERRPAVPRRADEMAAPPREGELSPAALFATLLQTTRSKRK